MILTMNHLENVCQCACGAHDFQVRLKRDEQVGLLTCAAGHHSLLLDSRDYWADVLQDGRPKMSRCRCGSVLFRVNLEYEFRQDGDVRYVQVKPICAACSRGQRLMLIDIDYSPTDQLVAKPLDPIEKPWLQPKRRQVTAFWKPADAERFATYLAQSLRARVFSENGPNEFTEVALAHVEFFPELKHDLLFTNIDGTTAPGQRNPEKSSPFLRLNGPIHMCYSKGPGSSEHIRLLHYITYSHEVMREASLEKQPALFLTFAREACDWLSRNYVSLRGKNTADNPEEYQQVKPYLSQGHGSGA
jgi:hypothetical protein